LSTGADAEQPLEAFENTALFGHSAVERLLLDAYRSGRMHHALMLCGPRGIGKATLAFRFARFLLSTDDPGSAAQDSSLAVPEDHPAVRQALRLAHPDLRVLAPRLFDEENKSGDIKVPHVRAALKALLTTAGAGGWRVCVVDAADDLNRNAANALLKALEEPPARTVFLLVAHRPGRLLATIRSRCLRIDMSPLSQAECRDALVNVEPACASDPDLDRLIEMGKGSPGECLKFRQLDAVELSAQIDRLFSQPVNAEDLHKLADIHAPARADERFQLLMELILGQIEFRSKQIAQESDQKAALEPWLGLWDKVNADYAATLALNLGRKQLILNSFFGIEAAARGGR